MKDLIDYIDDQDEYEWIEEIYNSGKFPFTHNSILDPNPNFGYDIEEFRPGHIVAMKFICILRISKTSKTQLEQ